MKRLVGFLVAAAAFCGAAAAFDTATCGTFLAGSWASDPKPKGKDVLTYVMELGADGAFAFRIDHIEEGEYDKGATAMAGTWSGAPGAAADTCQLTITGPDGTATNDLAIKDEATFVITGANETYHRQ